jgi:phosphoribosylformimino-5-aminoimidazole carboxamide ribotide isomerase
MTVIPVVDLLQGLVVRAAGGRRSAYRPIVSALCGSSDPVTVGRTLCDHCAAGQLYLADLDALQGGALQLDVLRTLLLELPQVELWLDGGFTGPDDARRMRESLGAQAARVVPVFGSESLASASATAQCFGPAEPESHQAILSLDRRGAERLDPAGCWDTPALWPRRVIVMTLERVGSHAGPDLGLLAALQARSPGTSFIGAGGIRDESDLARARDAGAAGWLVASALHDGRLSRRPR